MTGDTLSLAHDATDERSNGVAVDHRGQQYVTESGSPVCARAISNFPPQVAAKEASEYGKEKSSRCSRRMLLPMPSAEQQ